MTKKRPLWSGVMYHCHLGKNCRINGGHDRGTAKVICAISELIATSIRKLTGEKKEGRALALDQLRLFIICSSLPFRPSFPCAFFLSFCFVQQYASRADTLGIVHWMDSAFSTL